MSWLGFIINVAGLTAILTQWGKPYWRICAALGGYWLVRATWLLIADGFDESEGGTTFHFAAAIIMLLIAREVRRMEQKLEAA